VEGERELRPLGCEHWGEFRAPPADGRRTGLEGPGEWRWFCLDHVREFNSGYNYFSGMSPDEIDAAQKPLWGLGPRDPAFSMAARRRRAGRTSSIRSMRSAPLQAAIDRGGTKGRARPQRNGPQVASRARPWNRHDRRALRQRYADLVRRYHPDRNGGDRSHEKALQAVIEAYTQLKSRPAFA
jgi:curved DNA-binding protein CbpA